MGDAVGSRTGMRYEPLPWRWSMTSRARPLASRVRSLALLGVVLVAGALGGCRALEPAPVDSRDIDGAPTSARPAAKPPAPVASAPAPQSQVRQPAPARALTPKAAPARSTGQQTSPRPATARATERAGWLWPLRGRVVQGFRSGDRTRRGIRIAGSAGATVVAAKAGTVVYSGSGLVGYGNLIILEHDDSYLSAYGFNRKLLVREGDKVARGEQVAELGQAPGGQFLLHFEIRHRGSAVDPLALLPSR